jgi:hypothetical protein
METVTWNSGSPTEYGFGVDRLENGSLLPKRTLHAIWLQNPADRYIVLTK